MDQKKAANIQELDSSQQQQESAAINMPTHDVATTLNKGQQHLQAHQSRVGLNKEELMEYANQPFWVRLRNTLFASFWIIWLAAIVIAVGYVLAQPQCEVKPKSS